MIQSRQTHRHTHGLSTTADARQGVMVKHAAVYRYKQGLVVHTIIHIPLHLLPHPQGKCTFLPKLWQQLHNAAAMGVEYES